MPQGWAQWLRYAPDALLPARSPGSFPATSDQGKAIAAVYEIAGKGDFFLTGSNAAAARSATPTRSRRDLLALANAPADRRLGDRSRQRRPAHGKVCCAETVTMGPNPPAKATARPGRGRPARTASFTPPLPARRKTGLTDEDAENFK
jgi:hypothetical protein